VAISFSSPETPELYDRFTACCRLAKSLAVVTMVVDASELGTPFNGEIERLRIERVEGLDGDAERGEAVAAA
jgi:hypothetical protein